MDRINSSNMAVLSPGSRRGWQNQSLATGVPGTVFDQAFQNGLQEELLAIEETFGLVPNATTWTQVLQGLRRGLGGNITRLTATTTLTADHAGRVLVDASAGDVAITLMAPTAINGSTAGAAATNMLPIRIRRLDASSHTVTISPPSGASIVSGGATAGNLPLAPGGEWELIGDGVSSFFALFSAAQPKGFAASLSTGAFNWTAPAGVYFVEAEMWDAGAGGGYAAAANYAHGGGGGGYFRGVVPVVPGTVYNNTVGSGAAGGTSGSVNGVSVTATSVLAFSGGGVTFATGAAGGGGDGGTQGNGGSAPTVTGLSGGTYFGIGGGAGSQGAVISSVSYGGTGGGSFGGAAVAAAFNVGLSNSAPMPGCGGNGGDQNTGPQPGNNGMIILRW